MSLIEEDKINDAVNVEGILADFFLKKFEMKDAASKDDKEHQKKSKHKKHKSKKSKRKHKNSSRSSSSERTKHPVVLDLGHTSSSEEKDIKRLKKIKKLDSREPNTISSYFPVPLTAQTVLQTNDNYSAFNSSSLIENIPYGPSLELLLTGSESSKAEIDSGIQPKILSPSGDAGVSAEKSRGEKIDTLITSEISKEEITNLTCLLSESSKVHENLNTVEKVDSKLKILPNNVKSESSEITSIVSKQIDSKKKDIILNSVKKETTPDNEKEIKSKQKQSRSRSKSRSKAHQRSKSRSQSKSKTHSTQSKLRIRSRSKSKRRSRSRSRRRSRSRSRRRSSSKSRKRSQSNSRRRSRSRSDRDRYNHKSSKRRSYSRERSKSRRRSRSRHRGISRSRSKSNESSRKRNRRYKSRSRSRSHKNRSRSRSRSYSKDRDKTRHRSRSRSKEYSSRSKRESSHQTGSSRRRGSSLESKSRSKQKSRSNSKEKESGQSKKGKIDQAKILQIAQQNVLNMIEQGTLPEGLSVEHFKKDQFVSLKSGGKSVQELTDFCAEISKRENDQNDDTDGKNQANTQDGDTGFIHHPFKLKEQSVIKLNIKNAVQIPIKTHAEKFAETAKLSSQFPVSSGNQHKQKELEWIPVEPAKKTTPKVNEIKSIVPVTPKVEPVVAEELVKPNITLPSTVPSAVNVSYIPLPSPPIPAMTPPPLPPVPPLPPPPLPLPPPPPLCQIMAVCTTISQTAKIALPVYSTPSPSVSYPTTSPSFSYASPTAPSVSYPAQALSISYPVMSSCVNSFPPLPSSPGLMPPSDNGKPSSEGHSVASVSVKSTKPLNMSSIVQMRFKALTKLQEDPNDVEALKTIHEAQTIIQEWVQSQQVPGLFTGSTDAKLLTVEELCGPRHWNYRVKRDIFTRAAPVGEGKGMSLLKKMGWNPGEGLGKNKEGSLEPLVLDIKTDKKGLVSEGEGNKKTVGGAVKELQGKHPVSALMELCSKRKWKPPLYSIVADTGPPHKKLFLFKVEVNGVEYQPVTPSPNKKVAKADSAVVCLQALNVFPK